MEAVTSPMISPVPSPLAPAASQEALTPTLSRQLGRLFSAIELAPEAREQILAMVPPGAASIVDMPESVRFLWTQAIGPIESTAGVNGIPDTL